VGLRAYHIPILVGIFGLLVVRFWFVCDDAYITFRFARNLAQGNGLVFNPAEFPPVEGYSDFLWLLLAFGLELLGLRPDQLLPVLSAGCGVAVVVLTYKLARDRLNLGSTAAFLGAATVAASPAMGCWATSGLETMPQVLLTLWLFERLVLIDDERDWLLPAALSVMLALLRTEGMGWVMVIVGVSVVARVLERHRLERHAQRLLRMALPTLALFGAYQLWRFHYYGTWVPNTVLVKVAFGVPVLARGLKYVVLFWLTCLVPLLGLLAAVGLPRVIASGGRRGRWVAVLLLALAFPTYAVLVGGDFMPFGRLLLPGLPFAAWVLAAGFDEWIRRERGVESRVLWAGALLVALGALPAVDLHLVPHGLRKMLHFRLSDKDFLSELNRWENQKENSEGFTKRGLALAQVAQPSDTVVAAAVGAVGYWSGITIYDQHGLVTKEVAYREMAPGPLTQSPGHDKHVEPEYFVKYMPRFLYARALEGKLSAGRMKDALDAWEVPPSVMDRYVPDWYEVELPGSDLRTFLFVVRKRRPEENPADLWNEFPERRRQLNTELRSEYADEPLGEDDGSG
jgi:arabinofuranosyltransferase